MADTCLIRVVGTPFDDIIDGYFPLQISLAQMLVRNRFGAALVTLTHAPVLTVPDLAPDAPIPLSIRSGHAGLIQEMSLYVCPDSLSGFGHWRWLTPGAPDKKRFDPGTRLAEPVFLHGLGFVTERDLAALFAERRRMTDVQPRDRVWGPFPDAPEIALAPGDCSIHGTSGKTPTRPGNYIACQTPLPAGDR